MRNIHAIQLLHILQKRGLDIDVASTNTWHISNGQRRLTYGPETGTIQEVDGVSTGHKTYRGSPETMAQVIQDLLSKDAAAPKFKTAGA